MAPNSNLQDFLNDPTTIRLVAGDLEAIFLPAHGMIGASLRHKGVEMLGRVEDLQVAAEKGSTAGIPFLYPWANRLSESHYSVLGQRVSLNLSSPLIHVDEHGLPMHGVPWPLLLWAVSERRQDFAKAFLDWSSGDLLAIFPFRHRVELEVTIQPNSLTIATTIAADSAVSVPISFGFHPYLRIPKLPRTKWHLQLPAMRKLVLDSRGIPAGDEEASSGFDAQLGEMSFDDGFALMQGQASFAVAGAGRTVSVDLVDGFPYAQVYAPKDKDYLALEPMTAPTSALTSGSGLRFVDAGERFRAVFRIRIENAQ
ncbi:MAG TPA: aldose 1-epimerase [Candidatus Binataceae bacterium]|nr:aldose 1-epimerase [Candidatus Binataceae bacterium]